MPNKPLTVRLPHDLYHVLEQHASETKASKTELVVAALSHYFEMTAEVPLVAKVAHLEQRLAQLEKKVN
jgi:predicted transcriptional regulator